MRGAGELSGVETGKAMFRVDVAEERLPTFNGRRAHRRRGRSQVTVAEVKIPVTHTLSVVDGAGHDLGRVEFDLSALTRGLSQLLANSGVAEARTP